MRRIGKIGLVILIAVIMTLGYGGWCKKDKDDVVVGSSAPTNPYYLVGSYNTPGEAYGIYVSGSYAYVADFESGLQIINISNPASPSLAGSYDTPDFAYGVYVSGSYAYVADFDLGGLQIINISDPTNPTLTGSYDTSPGIAKGVYVSGSYA